MDKARNKEEATLVKGARKPFDEGRPSGSDENHTDMDHTVSAAEIIRDPAANAHMTEEEQIAFAIRMIFTLSAYISPAQLISTILTDLNRS